MTTFILTTTMKLPPGLHRDDAVIASSGTAPVVYISIP